MKGNGAAKKAELNWAKVVEQIKSEQADEDGGEDEETDEQLYFSLT